MKCQVLKYCYPLGNSLYVPLTSKCNSLMLPETRGPGFVLPGAVIASLCQVRDVEAKCLGLEPKWNQLCEKLSTNNKSDEKYPFPPRDNRIQLSDKIMEPKVKDLVNEVVSNEMASWKSIVIAGEGEPTLRLSDLIELIQQLHQERVKLAASSNELPIARSRTPSIRVTTNGLLSKEKSKEFFASLSVENYEKPNILDSFSVALMTDNADQYDELMQPVLDESNSQQPYRAYDLMKEFITSALQAGVEVEATAVDRQEVDKRATENVASELGITSPVRWRSYFP